MEIKLKLSPLSLQYLEVYDHETSVLQVLFVRFKRFCLNAQVLPLPCITLDWPGCCQLKVGIEPLWIQDKDDVTGWGSWYTAFCLRLKPFPLVEMVQPLGNSRPWA